VPADAGARRGPLAAVMVRVIRGAEVVVVELEEGRGRRHEAILEAAADEPAGRASS
jgi:hypothetical protein